MTLRNFLILFFFINQCKFGLLQRQRIDGGGNSRSNFVQQQKQQPLKFQQQYYQQNQQQPLKFQQQYYQQNQQQPKYYNTYENGLTDYNNGKTSSQWYYFPQQENYFPQQYSPQQQALNQQQQQFYSPQQQYSSPSSTSFASHVHGVPQLQATAAGAGGQYGGNNNAISGSQTQQQLQTFGSSAQQQLTQFSGGQQQQQGHQAIPLDRNGVVNNQLGNNNQSPNFYAYTTIAPLTLPPAPPTFATMMPSLFPTPPPQPVYDHALALRMHKLPYLYNFDFAPGTPVIYCAYGANPIPRYNTPYKKCIPYHPLCGITFTCIFDVDPETGHVWSHAAETKRK